jgi:hypothetical protein
MRAVRSCCVAVLVLGCGKAADRPADATGEAPAATTAAPADAAPAEGAATLSLADLAGTWKVHSVVEGNDKVTLDYDLVATGDRSGWTINRAGRDPIPVRVVAVEGDSIVTEAGPFESLIRKGVQVQSRTVMRMEDGKLKGTTTAHYQVSTADSVTRLSIEATRAP